MGLNSLMTALCDQVRRLTGASGKLGISKMTNELSKINLGVDVSGADAAAGDVLSGKKFVGSNGVVEEGGMTNNGAVSQTLTATKKSYTIPPGYHNGNGKVKINTQTKSVTPSSSAQTVNPDTGYLLSSVTVGAASSGKSVYTGTIFLSKSEVSQIQIDTGVTLKSGDTFILVIADSQLGLLAQIVSAIKIGNSVNRVYIASASGDDESGYSLDILESGDVTYSGTNAILNKGSYYYSAYSEYRWYVIKA